MACPTLNGPRLPFGNFSSCALSAVSCHSLRILSNSLLLLLICILHLLWWVSQINKPLELSPKAAASEGLCPWREE